VLQTSIALIIDADPYPALLKCDQDPAIHSGGDSDPTSQNDADADSQHCPLYYTRAISQNYANRVFFA
jgi:hypothetical protein